MKRSLCINNLWEPHDLMMPSHQYSVYYCVFTSHDPFYHITWSTSHDPFYHITWSILSHHMIHITWSILSHHMIHFITSHDQFHCITWSITWSISLHHMIHHMIHFIGSCDPLLITMVLISMAPRITKQIQFVHEICHIIMILFDVMFNPFMTYFIPQVLDSMLLRVRTSIPL